MAYASENEIDPLDVVAVVLFPIATGIVFGVWTMQLSLFGGWSPSDVVYTLAGADISWALLGTIGSLVWILGTNEINGSDYEDYELIVVAFGFLSPLLFVFVPAFSDLATYHDAVTLLVFLLTAAAATITSYVE